MESTDSLTKLDPRPISSPSLPLRPADDRDRITGQRGPDPAAASAPQFGITPSQIPDHPSSMMDVPRASNNYGAGPGHGRGPSGPSSMMAPQEISQKRDVPTLKSHCQYGLREYMSLHRKRQRIDAASTSTLDLENRLRTQQGIVISDLMFLHTEVRNIIKTAENHRWRKWIVGGAIASFIPLVRRIFRRGSDEESKESSNDTEYAFKKSQGLISYIKESILGKGGFAKIAFFVFAVLYVFQNEVSLRVAKTVQKRLRKLTARIERGDTDIDEKDLKVLDGWRWRVLLW